jgi:sugar phosphate isomerase/epimerase
MMKPKIGVQLYSVRDDCAQDLLGTIRKVAAIGYQGVEFAGYFGHSAAEIKAVLDETGIECCGAHVGVGEFTDEKFDATVKFHQEIGCPMAIIPWLPEEMRNTPEAVAETAKMFTDLAKKLEGTGISTGFHAHDADMEPLSNGKSAWYGLAEGTPNDFLLQYDTGNGLAGGADPVQPLKDFPGRSRTVHLKAHPIGIVIGNDDVPWKDVFEVCEATGGTEWYVVEHEQYIDMTPLEAVEHCYQSLAKMGKI